MAKQEIDQALILAKQGQLFSFEKSSGKTVYVEPHNFFQNHSTLTATYITFTLSMRGHKQQTVSYEHLKLALENA